MRRLRWLSVLLVAVVVLVGCGRSPMPSDPVRVPVGWSSEKGPEAVVWADGLPDDREWEDGPWVEAYRRARVLLAAARYARDYSDPELVGLMPGQVTPDFGPRVYEDWGRRMFYAPGPMPGLVTDVEVDGDSAVVTACEMPERLFSTAEEVAQYDPPFYWTEVRFSMHREGDRVVVDGTRSGGCELSLEEKAQVRVGLFDPPPPYGEPFDVMTFLGSDGEPYWPTYLMWAGPSVLDDLPTGPMPTPTTAAPSPDAS